MKGDGKIIMANTLAIRETVRRAKAEGIPIAESALRRWVKNGDIYAVHAGNKALLYWPKDKGDYLRAPR